MDGTMTMGTVAVFDVVMGLVADWYTLVLSGVILLFLIPAIVLILFYAVAVFLYAYKTRRKNAITDKDTSINWSDHFWDSARLSVCTFASLVAKYWHGKKFDYSTFIKRSLLLIFFQKRFLINARFHLLQWL